MTLTVQPGEPVTVAAGRDADTRGVTLDTDLDKPATDEAGPLTLTVGGVVTVTVSAAVGGNATGVVTVSPATLRFMASNWNTVQTLPAPSVADGRRLVFALTPALPDGMMYTLPVPSGGPGVHTYADGGRIPVCRTAGCRRTNTR